MLNYISLSPIFLKVYKSGSSISFVSSNESPCFIPAFLQINAGKHKYTEFPCFLAVTTAISTFCLS